MAVPVGVPLAVPVGVPLAVHMSVPTRAPTSGYGLSPNTQKKSYTKLQKIIQIGEENMRKYEVENIYFSYVGLPIDQRYIKVFREMRCVIRKYSYLRPR